MGIFKRPTRWCNDCKGTGRVIIRPVSQVERRPPPARCKKCQGTGRVPK